MCPGKMVKAFPTSQALPEPCQQQLQLIFFWNHLFWLLSLFTQAAKAGTLASSVCVPSYLWKSVRERGGESDRTSSQYNGAHIYNPNVLIAVLGKANGNRHVSNYFIQALGRLKQKDYKFDVIRSYRVGICLTGKSKKRTVDLIHWQGALLVHARSWAQSIAFQKLNIEAQNPRARGRKIKESEDILGYIELMPAQANMKSYPKNLKRTRDKRKQSVTFYNVLYLTLIDPKYQHFMCIWYKNICTLKVRLCFAFMLHLNSDIKFLSKVFFIHIP